MSPQATPITWSGGEEFRITGTGLNEDTLRIESNYKDRETTLRLVLPTLCITYAHMQFTNAVGGKQENYPASAQYGPAFFDPPVVIHGKEDVEKFTWIRGAFQVVIGPAETVVEWNSNEDLVIPRLRLKNKDPVIARLTIDPIAVEVDRKLCIDVIQVANGRHIGGIRIEKHHPEQREPEEGPPRHSLWTQVQNEEDLEPLPESILDIFMRHPEEMQFHQIEQGCTDAAGSLFLEELPAEELMAVTCRLPGWWFPARCYRPLAGERVGLEFYAARLEPGEIEYAAREDDNLENLALLTGFEPELILEHAGGHPEPGMHIMLPCYKASYCLQEGETLEEVAAAFAYQGLEELLWMLGTESRAQLETGRFQLPGWRFIYARQEDTLDSLEERFNLPNQAARFVGRLHHPDPRRPYLNEIVAIPTPEFASERL